MSTPIKPGYFITLEGIEGVGKSTHLKFIEQYLQTKKIPTLITREPGGTPVAEKIREILLGHHTEKLTQDTELLLLFASRSQHLNEVIRPALEKGQWVICDRFTDTTYAYQGGGRGVSQEKIATLETWVQGDLQPDLILLFDAPIEITVKRTQRRGNPDRFEAEKKEFFHRARATYLARAKQFPERYRVIDATTSLAVVRGKVKKILGSFA